MYEDIRVRLLEKVEESAINKDDLILAMAKYLTTQQIVEMLDMNNMTEIILDYDEVMPLGDAENWVGWMDKYKSGENK